MERRMLERDLRVGVSFRSYDVKRDVPVSMTIVGRRSDRWLVRSDLLGIEVEATTAELLDGDVVVVG